MIQAGTEVLIVIHNQDSSFWSAMFDITNV
jgi:hypothetical protein